MELLSSLPYTDLGAGALLALVVILIVRGDLVPRKVHEEVRGDRDRLMKVVETQAGTIDKLSRGTELGVHALTSLEAQAAAARPNRQGD